MPQGKTPNHKEGKKKSREIDPIEQMKWEIAEEIGLTEKVARLGWGSLSAAETGRIGGLMTKRMREAGFLASPSGT
ncbi:hypothetical protein SY88_06210 [Clostridiales bacterium PH28_bin88]|nr:hypothetical protein SY88_06210 [Clostridiales bacterium PH28_bin88]